MARTYESALSHLAALQSNRAITSLFDVPATTTTSTPPSKTEPAQPPALIPTGLNSLAKPEMLIWLQRAGLSQTELSKQLRCIHIAGTKGKGSVCAYLTALLVRSTATGVAGRVGTYTSPHLVSVRERIAIDGEPISRDLFARYFFEVWDKCTEAARGDENNDSIRNLGEEERERYLQGPATKPFYFRFLTLVALRAFIGEGVRSAVIEVGIGGEYDPTTAALPDSAVTVSVVTQLGIDHVSMLGKTLPEIAWHKAGVCRPDRKCFTRRLEGEEETMRVLRSRADEKGTTLVEVEDADVETWGGVRVVATDDRDGSKSGYLEGDFQKYNQALAVLAAREHLHVLASESSSSSLSFMISKATTTSQNQNQERLGDVPSSFTEALQDAKLRGRCETRQDSHAPITWFVDGAHTPESLAAAARWFAGKISTDTDDVDTDAILLFNQQERDAAKLVTGLMQDISAAMVGGERQRIFTHAIFSRNDLEPRTSKPEQEQEAERDLSVQQSAAAALQGISPNTTTMVLDNVADAVAKIRALALANQQQLRDKGQDKDVDVGGRRTKVLVTGSLHLIGAFLRTLEPDAED